MPIVDPKDLPTLKPWQAARELRTGIRHALNHFVTGSHSMVSLKKLVLSRNERRHQYAAQVDETIKAMHVSLDARRTKEAREHLSSLASSLAAERNYVDSAFSYVLELPDKVGGNSSLSRSTLETLEPVGSVSPDRRGRPCNQAGERDQGHHRDPQGQQHR